MKWARKVNGRVAEIFDGNQDIIIGDVRHPRAAIRLWPEADLLALGLEKVAQNPKPVHNSATHKAVLRNVQIGDADARETWTIVALTPEQIRDRIDPSQDLADALINKGLISKADLKSRLGKP